MKLNINISEFKRFSEKTAKNLKENYDKAIDDSLNELGGRLLNKVIRKTPVGKSIKDKINNKIQTVYTGGNLKRSWYLSKLIKTDDKMFITLYNISRYAIYVEYGHRQTPGRFVPAIGKKLKASWVKGRFMMTNSVTEINKIRQTVFNRNLAKYMEDKE
ncbi:type I neck protein [Fusobacterium phage FNU_1P]|nr:type I neck protein [Fusobacterium phage FNU_1P]